MPKAPPTIRAYIVILFLAGLLAGVPTNLGWISFDNGFVLFAVLTISFLFIYHRSSRGE